MQILAEISIKILVEAILITGILGFYFSKREERMKKTIEEEFSRRDKFFNLKFSYKQKALEELLAPVRLYLLRSHIAVKAYQPNDDYRETILKECNVGIRDVLIQKGHLIPDDLMPHAEKFISHYDEWLQAYRQAREDQNLTQVKHVFTYNFPHDSEKAFIKKYEQFRAVLGIEEELS